MKSPNTPHHHGTNSFLYKRKNKNCWRYKRKSPGMECRWVGLGCGVFFLVYLNLTPCSLWSFTKISAFLFPPFHAVSHWYGTLGVLTDIVW